ncbi:MAG: hypothetical protein ACJ8AT_19360 [Hyalangium sp.]|uniref:hypothetical protein n=1 Tax=Hyalangium sp. TaxID=2028555 RepID=UPI003899E46B
MELIAYLLIGAATGLLCRVILPQDVRMGLVRFLIVGAVGGGAGGMFTGTFYAHQEAFRVDVPTLIGAFVGAAIAVFVVASLSRRSAHV